MGRLHPETLPRDEDGRTEWWGGRQHFSHSSATYRRYAAAITEDLAARYAGHPALTLWHINNEYCTYDYGDEAAAAFRRWLRAKYVTLDALNAAWGTAFWSASKTYRPRTPVCDAVPADGSTRTRARAKPGSAAPAAASPATPTTTLQPTSRQDRAGSPAPGAKPVPEGRHRPHSDRASVNLNPAGLESPTFKRGRMSIHPGPARPAPRAPGRLPRGRTAGRAHPVRRRAGPHPGPRKGDRRPAPGPYPPHRTQDSLRGPTARPGRRRGPRPRPGDVVTPQFPRDPPYAPPRRPAGRTSPPTA